MLAFAGVWLFIVVEEWAGIMAASVVVVAAAAVGAWLSFGRN